MLRLRATAAAPGRRHLGRLRAPAAGEVAAQCAPRRSQRCLWKCLGSGGGLDVVGVLVF